MNFVREVGSIQYIESVVRLPIFTPQEVHTLIAERTSGVTVQGNLSGESYRAGIDDENMGWVISLFTDLYSDPEKAVIREYSTNARDALIEAGMGHLPIEVTLPTPLSPFFTVRDLGVGLTREDIQKVYSRYGTSTKRGTNDQNGMLGMGCKSALAYAEQFTVTSVKGGVSTVCSISREDDGVPVFMVVGESPTSEPNGTTITVPVRRHNEFARKAADFYATWEPGTVLVNGEQPKRLDGLRIADDMVIVKKEGYSYSSQSATLVVMGGVTYPVDNDKLNTGLPSNYSLYVTVPIGAADFAPSREALLYNTKTKATLAAIPAKVQAATAKAVQAEVEKATTARGAIQAMLDYRDLMPRGTQATFKFKGRDLPHLIAGSYILVNHSARKLSQHDKAYNGFNVEYAPRALFVTGYEPTTFTATHKRKLMQYAEDTKRTVGFYALTPATAVDMTWIEADQVVSWEDVKKVTLPKSSPVWRNGRPTGAYDAFTPDSGGYAKHIQADEIDTAEDIFYFRALNKSEANNYVATLRKFYPDCTMVCVPENRHAKFMRFFPDAKSHREGIQAAYDTWRASLTKGQRIALAMSDSDCDTDLLGGLDATKVDDPALKRSILIARNVDVRPITRQRQQFRNVLGTIRLTTDEWENPLERYTLLDSHYGGSYATRSGVLDHLYYYLNAAYVGMEAAAQPQAVAA